MTKPLSLLAFALHHVLLGALGLASTCQAQEVEPVSYQKEIAPLLQRYCGGCHNPVEREGDFVATSYAGLQRGTKDHRVLQGGDPRDSRLWRLISGVDDPAMPPKDEPQLSPQQKGRIEQWIREGAKGSDQTLPLHQRLVTPKIQSRQPVTPSITALAVLSDADRLTIGTFGNVSSRPLATNKEDALWSEQAIGKVAQIRLSRDGQRAIVASGIAGLGGEVSVRDALQGKLLRRTEAHQDAIYSALENPHGNVLASAGYDRKIHLYDALTLTRTQTLEGHHGAIYDLDFDPSGALLASASADETVKIWNVRSGERLDTLGQGEAEQYVVRFSEDGNWIVAAGADRRIRVWRVESREKPAINPMVHSVFAHEGSVLALSLIEQGKKLLSAGEDKKVKLWSMPDMEPLGMISELPDIPTAIGYHEPSQTAYVACMDGTMIRLPLPLTPSLSGRNGNTPLAASSDPVTSNLEPTRYEEIEPNSLPSEAQPIALPATIIGKIESLSPGASSQVAPIAKGTDEDWYRFEAKANEEFVLSVDAARSGSALDSRIEVCDEQGNPVLRTRVQAVRETYFTFRGKNSDVSDDFRLHRWEDMELNEYLFAGGEIVKLWLYPRGPDSGFKVYPGFGSRFTYFDTTATTHALGETSWIIRELGPKQDPIPNGLPVFPIYFENDDDSERRGGRDSKLTFKAPYTGTYLVRIRDARSLSGDKFNYNLNIQRPRPNFTIEHNAKDLLLASGIGQEFEVTARRIDGFQGPIQIHLEGLPDGCICKAPLFIEAGQYRALGTIHWTGESDSPPGEFQVNMIGSAELGGETVRHQTSKPLKVKWTDAKRVKIQVFPKDSKTPVSSNNPIVLRAGESISARVVAERGDFKGDIGFGTDDSGRNLPHGVVVGNIGLSGLLIPAGQDQQEVFLQASPWIQPQQRLFHLRANIEGNPTTVPLLLEIVRP